MRPNGFATTSMTGACPTPIISHRVRAERRRLLPRYDWTHPRRPGLPLPRDTDLRSPSELIMLGETQGTSIYIRPRTLMWSTDTREIPGKDKLDLLPPHGNNVFAHYPKEGRAN